MQQSRIPLYAATALLAGSIMGIHYAVQRPDLAGPGVPGFWLMALLLGAAALGYAILLQQPDDDFRHWWMLRLSVLLRLSLIAFLPPLTDDFYRYLWDGQVTMAGDNPYALSPELYHGRLAHPVAQQWQGIYQALNSKQFYTVYPPLMQAIFALGHLFSPDNLLGAVVLMRLLVCIAEAGTIYWMGRLLQHLGLPRSNVLLYALNPLVILELTGNLHTEAFMICFVMMALWCLVSERWVWAALALAMGVAAKLLPILLFPFLLRRLSGRPRKIVFGLALLFGILLFLPLLIPPSHLSHMQSSLHLYFQYFEFNSPLHGLRALMSDSLKDFLSTATMVVLVLYILAAMFLESRPNLRTLPTAFLIVLSLYQLQLPVIHPWYLAPLVALAALGRYRYAILWSCLAPFTYIAYWMPGIKEQAWLINVEYFLLFGYMTYEWMFKRKGQNLTEWLRHRTFFKRLMLRTIPARLRIKRERIQRHLERGTRILDVGAGHGGLCETLRTEGFDITPLDIQDLSLFPDVRPIIYNGREFPFRGKGFHTSMLITMLHHTPDPEIILTEATRVTQRRIVVMEDIYSNWLQRELTYFTDSLVNLEFEGHPHTNKTDTEWRELFDKLGLKLVFREDFRTLVFFRQVIYVLELPE